MSRDNCGGRDRCEERQGYGVIGVERDRDEQGGGEDGQGGAGAERDQVQG